MPDWPPPGVDDDATGDDDDATGDDDTTAGDDDSAADDDTGDDDTVTVPADWVLLTGDTFDMGSDDGLDHELPVHPVTVPDFEIWRTEVTVEQYQACITAGACTEPGYDDVYCNWNLVGFELYPVNCLDWDQAFVFCEWLDARLPSEAEWEFAARSRGLDIDYPWGDDPADCDLAVMDDPDEGGNGCGTGRTWTVCSRSPAGDSDQGLCDMAGNVWEWLQDHYHDSYEGAPTDGTAWEVGGDVTRITRGASSGNEAPKLIVTFRDFADPAVAIAGLGVRCARNP